MLLQFLLIAPAERVVGEEEGCKLAAAFVKKQIQLLVENAACFSFDMVLNLIHHLLCSSTEAGLAYKFCFFVVEFVKQL